jgi:hypothetical protein
MADDNRGGTLHSDALIKLASNVLTCFNPEGMQLLLHCKGEIILTNQIDSQFYNQFHTCEEIQDILP